MQEKTIAAISTARGQGGLGVIRISGENAIEIADKVFVSVQNKNLKDTPGYTARYGKIFNGDEFVDEAVALVFRAPRSYTGEDVVELSCHGGIFVTEQILRLVIEKGAELAAPGEFTQRAFLNGKLGLTEAESVMDLISAQSRQAARAAACLHEGALSKRIGLVKDKLVSMVAHLDAFADYPEDEIPEVNLESLEESLRGAVDDLEQLLKTYDAGRVLREGVDTAIVGKPNVGKSTLMNLLLGCERCIVTDIPGTTRDLVEETLLLGDVKLRVSDTAGIHETQDVVEKIGVDKAHKKLQEAQLVFAVFDFSRPLEEEDRLLINRLKGLNAIAIINKTDLAKKLDTDFIEKELKNVVYMSAKKNNGLKELETMVSNSFNLPQLEPEQGILNNQRQYFAVRNACDSLKEAIDAILLGVTLDAITVLIEEATDELLRLTGEKASEAVINEVFSKFCVGK